LAAAETTSPWLALDVRRCSIALLATGTGRFLKDLQIKKVKQALDDRAHLSLIVTGWDMWFHWMTQPKTNRPF